MLLIRYIRPLSLFISAIMIYSIYYRYINSLYIHTPSLSECIAFIVYHNFSSNNEALQESIVLRLLKCEKLFSAKAFVISHVCGELMRLSDWSTDCAVGMNETEWMDVCVCVGIDRSLLVGLLC